MVFPSIPVYQLDPPPNWQQQPNQLLGVGNEQQNGLQLPPVPVPGPAGGQSRPNSMADRARLAKIPHPEAALKCPRCESTNTKFCYYNNYSLSQPRHFCKTCRRYWTRGGALRNVPVGGGCRKNKRSKGRGGSKSQATTATVTSGPAGSAAVGPAGTLPPPLVPGPAHLPFLPPLQSLGEYGDLEFQVGGSGQVMVPNGLIMGTDQWRTQQFPNFLANFGIGQPAGGSFQFDQGDEGAGSNQGLNLMPRSFLGFPETFNHQPSWTGNNGINAWSADTSGLAASSIASHQQ